MLVTKVAGVELPCCIYNASGPRTGSIEALVKIAESTAGCVLSKSATKVEQAGNGLPRFVNKIPLGGDYCDGSLNSEGLPNYGIDYYIKEEHIKQLQAFSKPYIVSISGLNVDDNLEMLQKAMNTPGVSAIELNLACPNIPGKPMVAYDYDQLDIALGRVCKLPGYGKIPIGVKLAPYFDIPHFQRVADILAKYPIHYIVSVNTIPNGLVIDFDNECEGIVPKQGLGGLAGGFIKHTALANVRTLYNMLQERGRSDIDIVGVGGVRSGKDAFELILCGAKAVQVGTCHWTEGSGCFDRIAKELQEIMVKRGYKRIEDFRGKLKPYRRPARKAANEGVEKSAATTASKSGNQFDLLHIVLVAAVALLSILLAFGKSLFGL